MGGSPNKKQCQWPPSRRLRRRQARGRFRSTRGLFCHWLGPLAFRQRLPRGAGGVALFGAASKPAPSGPKSECVGCFGHCRFCDGLRPPHFRLACPGHASLSLVVCGQRTTSKPMARFGHGSLCCGTVGQQCPSSAWCPIVLCRHGIAFGTARKMVGLAGPVSRSMGHLAMDHLHV